MDDNQPRSGAPTPGSPAWPDVSEPIQEQPSPAPPPKRGKRGILITLVLLVVGCVGICGVGQLITNFLNQDDWEGLGEPVPAVTPPASLKPSWQPDNQFVNPQPVLEIRHQLESWVLASAGVVRPMSSTCDQPDFTGKRPATLTCTVTYDGRDVVYTVSARPSGAGTFEWDGKATETVVTREGLLALVGGVFGGNDWTHLRCEEFPEVAVVPVGKSLSQVCYAKAEDRIKTSKIMITPTDQAKPHVLTEHQEEGLR